MPKARPTKKRKPQLADSAVVAQAEENEKLEARIDKLNQKLLAGKKIVIDELDARGTRALEHGGRRITLVKSTYEKRDYEGIRAALKPKQRKLVTKEVVDASLLSQAIQAGQIDMAEIKPYVQVLPKAPYYLMSDVKTTAKKR